MITVIRLSLKLAKSIRVYRDFLILILKSIESILDNINSIDKSNKEQNNTAVITNL